MGLKQYAETKCILFVRSCSRGGSYTVPTRGKKSEKDKNDCPHEKYKASVSSVNGM